MKSQDSHAILDRRGPVCQRPAGGAGGEALAVVERPRHRLSLRVRIAIFVVGWALVAFGVVGLFLPVLQGGLTILAGAALLSIDNQMVYRFLRRGLHRWPWLWEHVERFREKAHHWAEKLHRPRR
jgi:hypothetical protein